MDWNVMTRTRGGTVSLIKNLSYQEAQGLMQRLRRPFDTGNPWGDPVRQAREQVQREVDIANGIKGWSGGFHHCSNGDLEQIECWGPPGEKMEVWPKPDGWDEAYGCALNAARAEKGLPL